MTVLRSQQGFDLSATDYDFNFFDLKNGANRLETNPPIPVNGLADVQFSGDSLTLHFNDGSRAGPFIIPSSSYTWRGDFAASTAYDAFDVFGHALGIFLVLSDFTSGPTLNPSTDPVQLVFGPLGDEYAARPVANIPEAAMTLSMAYAGWYLRNSIGCTFRVPSDTTADFVDGVNFAFRQSGTDSLKFEAADGVTINHSSDTMMETAGTHAVAYLRRVGQNTWDLFGDLRLTA